VVLDHHKSAAEKLTGYQCRCGVVHFDMNKSGARLAWEFFHPDKPVPGLIRYVEDRDIWKWEFPESPAFLAALEMEPRSIARWAEIAAFTPKRKSSSWPAAAPWTRNTRSSVPILPTVPSPWSSTASRA
jgi:oligoribonuclease NrnB/cAMP/cGMP phosphodiesterase (DHH superfamily)